MELNGNKTNGKDLSEEAEEERASKEAQEQARKVGNFSQ